MKSWISGAAAFGLLTSTAAAIDTISIKGSKFFTSSGDQFFMKGVAYQRDVSSNTSAVAGQTYTDPLADATGCARDIPYLQKLNTNTIRVYAVDPTQNHDTCMKALSDAGIYLVLDLSNPSVSINRDDPVWTTELFNRYASVVDAFAKYDNLLGFFAGNEVSNQKNNTAASAFVKAAVRDTKQYIKSKNYRSIGVGYATNDDKDIRVNMASFFNCGDASDSIDFWGYNVYSWCGDSDYEKSGYKERTEEFANYSVPVFFAEYGCNDVKPRKFTEVGALYSSPMTDVWSGGIVYMYFQEANEFGLVDVSGNSVSPRADYTYLSSEIAKATPTGVKSSAYNPTNTAAAACPAVNSDWQAKSSPLPPAANSDLCSCMYKSLSCVVSSNVDADSYGELFGQVCGYSGSPCAGINRNGTTGAYGAYSMCSPKEQLSFAFNVYAKSQSSFAQACSFGGKASTQNAATATSSACASAMSQAGAAGTGTVSGGGVSASGGSSSGGAGNAAFSNTVPAFDFGFVRIGAYVAFAAFSGAAMILL